MAIMWHNYDEGGSVQMTTEKSTQLRYDISAWDGDERVPLTEADLKTLDKLGIFYKVAPTHSDDNKAAFKEKYVKFEMKATRNHWIEEAQRAQEAMRVEIERQAARVEGNLDDVRPIDAPQGFNIAQGGGRVFFRNNFVDNVAPYRVDELHRAYYGGNPPQNPQEGDLWYAPAGVEREDVPLNEIAEEYLNNRDIADPWVQNEQAP